MNTLRLAIAAAAACILLLLAYMFFLHPIDHGTEPALVLYQAGRNDEAQTLLQKMEPKIPAPQYHLYQAYILRDKYDLPGSDKELAKAIEATGKNREDPYLAEITINQAFNAFLEHQPDAMKSLIEETAILLGARNGWVAFLSNLQTYLVQKQTQSLTELAKHSNSTPLSRWMKKAFSETFNPFWFTAQTARSYISEGNFVQARQVLEAESKHATESQLNDINLLLGLSYLNEAEEKPPIAATPYYKLAFSYFNRVPMQSDKYLQYRNEIFAKLDKQLNALLDKRQFQDLTFYMSSLEAWGAHSETEKIKSKLISLLNQESKDAAGVQEIANVLNRLVTDPEERLELKKSFDASLKKALANGNTTLAEKYWQADLLFSPDPTELSNQVAEETVTNALELIPLDSDSLLQTVPYIEFWSTIVKDPQQRNALAAELLNLAEQIWMADNQSQKALNLIKIATQIPPLSDRPAFHAKIATALKGIYGQALKSNNVSALKSLQAAMRDLNLPNLEAQGQSDAERQLQQASQFFDKKQYAQALQKANWVLVLEPQNNVALKIAGLSAYAQGDYAQALEALNQVKDPDEESVQAQTMAKIITGDATADDALKNVTPENYVRLGVGFLLAGNSHKSLEWLEKVKDPNPEVLSALVIASSSAEDWKKTDTIFQKLPAPYKQIPALKLAEYEALKATGKKPEAEALLQSSLIKGEKAPSGFEGPFALFKKVALDPISNEYLAALYYNEIQKNPQKALATLKKITPNPRVKLEMCAIQLTLGNPLEAKNGLKQTLEEIQGTPAANDFSKRALPLLAESYRHLQDNVDAVYAYANFYKTFPNEMRGRGDYAQALQDIQLYSVAEEQYLLLEKAQPLKGSEKIGLVSTLVHTAQFDKAADYARKIASELTPAERYDLLVELMPMRNRGLMQKILELQPPQAQMDADTKRAYLHYAIEIGEYDKVLPLVKEMQKTLEATPQGLFLLAQLNGRLSNSKMALKYAQKALEKSPQDASIQQFVQRYQNTEADLKKRLDAIQERLKSDPDNISLYLDQAQTLIDYSLEVHLAQPSLPVAQVPQLRTAVALLQNMADKIKDLPRLYLLLGQADYLLDDNQAALAAFQTALKYDPSYVDAYKYLAQVYRDLKQKDQAQLALKTALQFAPGDIEVLQALASSYIDEGNTLDASTALESALRFKPNDINLYLKLADLKLNLQNPNEARLLLEKGIKIAPNNLKVRKLLLRTLYNPLLENSLKKEEIAKQQEAAYTALKALDPVEADKLRQEADLSQQN